MRRLLLASALLIGLALAANTGVANAGHPHFVYVNSSTGANSITASFKEAGLGDEAQVNITLSATAECINGGGNHPKAANKEQIAASTVVPVQNGQATGSLTLTSTLSCSPPMTIVFSNATLTDTTNGLSVNL